MTFCCGEELPERYRFCPGCGKGQVPVTEATHGSGIPDDTVGEKGFVPGGPSPTPPTHTTPPDSSMVQSSQTPGVTEWRSPDGTVFRKSSPDAYVYEYKSPDGRERIYEEQRFGPQHHEFRRSIYRSSDRSDFGGPLTHGMHSDLCNVMDVAASQMGENVRQVRQALARTTGFPAMEGYFLSEGPVIMPEMRASHEDFASRMDRLCSDFSNYTVSLLDSMDQHLKSLTSAPGSIPHQPFGQQIEASRN